MSERYDVKGKTVVVIGGGMGGLFTAALLTREGMRAVVLEKNTTIGGGLQTFRRNGVTFDTGMHILGGMREGGAIMRICQYLGIDREMTIRDADHDCIDEIRYMTDGTIVRVPEGREAFVSYFARLFPAEAERLRQYVDRLYSLSEEVNLFYLRPEPEGITIHSDDFALPADQLIARYIRDPRLRDILAYMNPMYAGVAGHTPAYIHALINVLYINGSSRFEGDSVQMAVALAKVIEEGGGRVLTQKEVKRMAVTDRRVEFVETVDGNRYEGDYYIADIAPVELIAITDDGAFPKAFRQRMEELPQTYSAFIVYIIFKDKKFPYINHTCYAQDDYGMVWDYDKYDADRWPRGFMYMTPSETGQGQYARKMIINCLMTFDAVEKWEATTTGRRGADYEEWKRQRVECVLAKMEKLYPGFRDSIADVYSSSPLTIRDYYHSPRGALYGIRKDCQSLMASQIPVFTKVRNLLLTGQNINLHGICGVPLTAINTAEAIVGRNVIVEKL